MNKQSSFSELPDKLRESLEAITKREGISLEEMKVLKFTTGGDNYLGKLFEVNMGDSKYGKEKSLNLFVKKSLPVENVSHLDISGLYSKEAFIYNELRHIFEDLQNQVNIPREERYQIAKGYPESNEHAIILENLTKKGFVTLNRMDGVTFEFAECVIVQLAKFHALSFITEKTKPDYFKTKISTVKHPFLFNDAFDKIISTDDEILDFMGDDVKVKVKNFLKRSKEVYRRGLEDVSHKSVLCHGDYRTNNIFARFNNSHISEVVPVDYQMIYYGSPLIDFFYFIYTSTDQKLRKEHLTYLKETYYATMARFLARFGVDIEDVFSKEEYERSYNDFLEFGLAIAFIMTPFIFAKDDSAPEYGTEWSYKLDDRYKQRIHGIVLDFIELGIL